MTTEEVMGRLGVSHSTPLRMAYDGRLHRANSLVLYYRADVEHQREQILASGKGWLCLCEFGKR